jgi:hypothetical protein
MLDEHISIDRAWILITGSSPFSVAEGEHVEVCEDCKEFLRSLVSVARYVVFSVDFPRLDDAIGREQAA